MHKAQQVSVHTPRIVSVLQEGVCQEPSILQGLGEGVPDFCMERQVLYSVAQVSLQVSLQLDLCSNIR